MIRKYIDESFFKIWSSEMAYVFGYWIADGNMGKNKNTISFVSIDYDLLKMIKSIFNSEHKIMNYKNWFSLSFCNKIMYNDLLKLGGIPAKSLIIQFPEVPDRYLSHFVRGFFDGDGSFFINIDKRLAHHYKYLASNFTGNIDFLTVLEKKIKDNAGIDSTGLYSANISRISYLTYFNKKAIVLGNYMYEDSENLRLERKFKIYYEKFRKHSQNLDLYV